MASKKIERIAYFSVGEMVQIQNTEPKQFHGQSLFHGQFFHVESIKYLPPGYMSESGQGVPAGFYYFIAETDRTWPEIALKKVYEPSDKSMKELLNDLNKGIQ